MNRPRYPTDVSADEWAFVAPYLTLMREDSPQRDYELREVLNALRWLMRAGLPSGLPWRLLPHDLPPWQVVYQQAQRWLKWGCFEALVHDIRVLLQEAQGKKAQPSVAILDGRTVQSSVESGGRSGFEGSKVHLAVLAVDTLGHLLSLVVTPANKQERAQVAELCQAVQEVTGQNVTVAFVDQGYTGQEAKDAALQEGIALEVVKHPEATTGFVLLPKRWGVERSIGWTARFRRLARDYERLPETLGGLHFVVFATLMLALDAG